MTERERVQCWMAVWPRNGQGSVLIVAWWFGPVSVTCFGQWLLLAKGVSVEV